MKNKKRIKLLAQTFSVVEIAETLGLSPSYVYRVLRENSRNTLTPTNYVNAILSGLTTNEEIAELFNVSPSTIKRFKSQHGLKITTAQYLYFTGWNMERIKKTLHLTNAESVTIETVGTFEEIKYTLRTMQNTLQPYKGKIDQITEQLKTIAKLLQDLEC